MVRGGVLQRKNARQTGYFQPIERRSCKGSVAVRQCLHFDLGEKALTAPRVGSPAAMIEKRPRQELNLIYDLRRVACCPSHSKDQLCFITPPRNRTSPDCFEGSHASSTLAGHVDLALKSRRLDSHQHKPVYKTGAFLSRATSAEAAIAAAQARGFEPRLSVLEADCSPRSTLVML
jgi:hypothetical protein